MWSSWVGMSGGELYLAERYPGVDGRHDESGPEHVRVDRAEPGSLAHGLHPAVGGTPVQEDDRTTAVGGTNQIWVSPHGLLLPRGLAQSLG